MLGEVEQLQYARSLRNDYLNFLFVAWPQGPAAAELPGGHSEWEPPDPIPNSEVKPLSADDSVGLPCESRTLPGFLPKSPASICSQGFFSCCSCPLSLIPSQGGFCAQLPVVGLMC